MKKFSSSVLRSGFKSSGFGSATFSDGAEKKLENMSSLAGLESGLVFVSRPRRSAAPFEVLLRSGCVGGVFLPNFGLTDDFGFGILGMTSDF